MSNGGHFLTDYFCSVDKRIGKQNEGEGTSFRIKVCGKIIEQRFTLKAHADSVKKYMVGILTEETGEPDSIFYYWTEDVSVYEPPQAKTEKAVWQCKDDTGFLRVTPGYGMVGVDFKRNIYYFCREPKSNPESMLYGHAMIVAFGQWAKYNNMLLLHSACVGVNGRGILISARGGGGKSTLAVSCLLGGFDFVSDDYVLVTKEGPLKAFPIYRTVSLNQDMNALLKPGLDIVRIDRDRKDKLMLDASSFKFSEELPIDAIICPDVRDIDSPVIQKTKPGPVLVKLIDSTASQLGVFRDPEPYRIMSQRLIGLPVYEILLSPDLGKNREALRNFIKEEF